MPYELEPAQIPEAEQEGVIAAYIVRTPGLPAQPLRDSVVHVGWDTEYQQVGDRNDVVSTQLWFLEAGLGLLIHWQPDADRLTLLDIVRIAFRVASRKLKGVETIRLICHYSAAEFSTTRWRWNTSQEFTKLIAVDDCFVSVGEDEVGFHDASRNWKEVMVSFHDTFLLSGKAPLGDLGRSLGLPKVELPGDAIRAMRRHSNDDFEGFVSYAVTDAFITASWFSWFDTFRRQLVPDSRMPLTASHLAGQYLLDRCGEYAIRAEAEGGSQLDTTDLAAFESSYHGGRNECYEVGLIDEPVTDTDFVAAYPTALMALADPDWSSRVPFSSVGELPGPFVVGAAMIDYEFVDDCLFPAFAEQANFGLVFPLRGGGIWVTIPELWSAWHSGFLRKLKLHEGRCFYFAPSTSTSISTAVAELVRRRRSLQDRNSPEGLLLKLLANSCYGKLSQGVNKRKSAFDLQESLARHAKMQRRLEPGPLYSPGLGAYITGSIRAVLFEVCNEIAKRGQSVLSATTDGLLHTGKFPADVAAGSALPLMRALAEKRVAVLDDTSPMVETKHTSSAAISLKTRLSWGVGSPGGKHHIQRGGLQTRDEHGVRLPVGDALRYMNDRYGRWDWKSVKTSLAGLSMMFDDPKPRRSHHEEHIGSGRLKALPHGRVTRKPVRDLLDVSSEITINADYDLKRRPVRETLAGSDLACIGFDCARPRFSTRPWETVEEAIRARGDYAAYCATRGRNIMRSVEDVADFLEYQALRQIADGNVGTLDQVVARKLARVLLAEQVSPCDVMRITGLASSTAYKMRATFGGTGGAPMAQSERKHVAKSGIKRVPRKNVELARLDPIEHRRAVEVLDQMLASVEPDTLRKTLRARLVVPRGG